MKFNEAFALIESGAWVRRQTWIEKTYITEDSKLRDITTDDLQADDWVEKNYKNDRLLIAENLSFSTAMELQNHGLLIRRKSWSDGVFFKSGALLSIDMRSKDWSVYK